MNIDESNCSTEPIHIPGQIQPHGFFMVISKDDFTILNISENCTELFAQKEILGKSVLNYLDAESIKTFSKKATNKNLKTVNPIRVKLKHQDFVMDVVAHVMQDHLFLEWERPLSETALDFSDVYRLVNETIEEMESAKDFKELCEVTVKRVKEISGYLRIMIYEFDADWNGKVIAEAKEPQQDPFLGLQYPASDIPAQARELYRQNWIRIIPNVSFTPVSITPQNLPDGQKIDLSFCSLRSVSKMHTEYLKNMQVGASMSVSLKKDNQLWGLIACHHDRRAYLSYEVRQGLEFIGKFFSVQLVVKKKEENKEYAKDLEAIETKLFHEMRTESSFIEGLYRDQVTFLDLVHGTSGGAVYSDDRLTLIGSTPTEEEVRELIHWLNNSSYQPIFSTISLSEDYPPAEKYKDKASGLLSMRIAENIQCYILWFKPEVIQTVNWGGKPEKNMEMTQQGLRLTPRRSFELWQETVKRKALPWTEEELRIVSELRRSIIEINLQRQIKAVQESNEELDQFAHIISHDLKEPLRGIGNFSDFLMADLKDKVDHESVTFLTEIKELSQKARNLISELYEYSKVGKIELAFDQVDLNLVVQECHQRLKFLFLEKKAEYRFKGNLPETPCDRVRISEVFANLISNALKYNDKTNKWVEVGVLPTEPPQFFVKDNGIGIPEQEQPRIFKMFQRLHSSHEFGGGTGSGLPIVKRIIDRHGGKIWIQSDVGVGTTFFFTLRPEGSKDKS